MRIGATLTALVILAIAPGAASATTCIQEPFEDVVRSSDVVLVATVVDATVKDSILFLQLDADEVLKGSSRDGVTVRDASCGLAMLSREGLRQRGKSLIGTRGLYLLERDPLYPDGSASVSRTYPGITTPRLSLAASIARARDVLGLSSSSPTDDVGDSLWTMTPLLPIAVAAGIVLAVLIVLVGWSAMKRRRLPPDAG